MNDAGEARADSAPVLIIQGDFIKSIQIVKMAVDRTVLEAESSILEALDRFYKLMWVFDLQYNDKAATFMMYMQTIYGTKYGTIPNTVTMLQSIVAKHT